MKNIQKISGALILFSFIFAMFGYFFDEKFTMLSLFLIWFGSFLLFFTIKNRKILNILLVLALLAFLYAEYIGATIDFKKAFGVNLYLLTLLISVSFLKLVATPRKEKVEELPSGKASFIKTYLSVHLFGSVINLSSVLLVADKLYKKGQLTASQVVLLTRAFASDAYWSPFFAAFAAALTYAPKLETYTIIVFGLVLSILSFIITYLDVVLDKKFEIDNFYGYPLSLPTLYLPLLLAILVLVTHYFYMDIKIIILISSFAFIMTLVILPIKKGFNEALKILKFYIIDDIPKMKNEISLFLVAGLFGVIVGNILLALHFKLPFAVFDYKVASIVLLIFIILAFVGIHPIISISVLGDFFTGANHTLLAMTFLMSWAATVSTSPISGLNLMLSARYDCGAKEIFRLNLVYATKMYIISVVCLYLLSKFLGI